MALPKDVPEHLLLEEKVERGRLLDWDISILQSIPMAASVAAEDTLKFTEFHSMGATYAVYLKAVNATSGQSKEGWVSCGSFMFPYKALRLSEQTSLVMPEREPQPICFCCNGLYAVRRGSGRHNRSEPSFEDIRMEHLSIKL